MKRQVYPDSTSLSEALRVWQEQLAAVGLDRPLKGETVPVDLSLGRITAEAVTASRSSPTYHGAAMDGVAVRFTDTLGASETRPVRLKVGSQACFVDTGDPLPGTMDAVIMIEEIDRCGEDEIEILAPATPYQHVRRIGEDIVSTELILPENHPIRPVDQGAMLAGGVEEVRVRRRPVVAVLPTGNELVQPGTNPKEGEITEFNSRILCGMVREWGGVPLRQEIVRDDPEAIRAAVLRCLEKADLVVLNAGSSAGREDYTVHVLRELGEVFVQGVNIKPGKPVILGRVRGKPVVGIPGYPVSAVLTMELFLKPLIHGWQGLPLSPPETLKATLSRQVASTLGAEEFVRVKVGRVGEKMIVTPVGRGAGMLMSLVRADGIVQIPAFSEGIAAREEVEVRLLRRRAEIDRTLVCIGSHDNSLDVLANLLKKAHPEMSLSSAHVGSMGGLMAIRRGEAHLAGTHLLDEESGEYNVPFVKRFLSDVPVVLVNLVYRQQGLCVPKGNPRRIVGFQDLTSEDVVFVNRQKGSGTRLLTDHHLKRNGIDSLTVRGYDREEYTHMGVASAVAGGTADTGVCILAAARALSLDFIPLARERYDFVIPKDFLEMEQIAVLLRILRRDPACRETIRNLGGYDVEEMGKIVYEGS